MQTYPTGYTESHRMAEKIFREILPRHGMAVREEQIALCHEVLDTLYNKEISLCEAGVGTGKTLVYLVACILWQMNRPERMKLPIVISTSSVALQDAILTEYLPELSAVLLDEGIIREPIRAVVRKGKERFVCDARLAERNALVQPSRKRQKNSLRIAENILDMDHIPELSRYDRCRICVPQLLRNALWNTREPTILTSGTLAAAGDFDHTEQLLGLAAYRPLRHFRADSPFNYKKKCLLYFPPRVKTRMDNRKMAEEIVRLVDACHGHALVLFTAYRQMAEVRALTDGQWPYPTYQAWRNGGKIIQKFKQSGNGVLFAAGSCWEGIDFPGDMVSLLIIAKLPFPIPDPVSDYERRQYPNLRDYINAEIIPEMQKKLRQGFGRSIRTEQDSCVVAILDERAGIGGKYHDAALAALPTCPITEKIEDVQQFIREQKRPDYFL